MNYSALVADITLITSEGDDNNVENLVANYRHNIYHFIFDIRWMCQKENDGGKPRLSQ